MFTRIAAGLLLCALAAPAAAQQIYKCVTKTGTEYQSTPCANGEAAKTWAVEVAPRSEGVIENERRLDAIRQQNSASIAPRPAPTQPVYRNGGGGARLHSISQYKDPDACEAAKAERERVFRMYGSNRPYMVGRRMDDMVWSACK
ncbi:DUF4124 domain-containing protein [Stenotrophomonas maltophilia]|uniref:DUF4124 domain-containing protein n=1 Tax=Stenotrophomonas maltophilia TaxID=40324 RepID=A0AA40Y1Y0_STEMA|nr:MULTISPECIES: DUF4124 domain-containing protein [Stenotrophomonas]MBH1583410.1 DUF4124 domain-containing protein [Stenotrophomonas maltophilia]MBH1718733.1 DUF4124 domain-containing protein [Stenotrophomonas maltophilia]MBH1789314.1 DUF4124 domain-containing protein [Stenotrophomonas maltophilia]MCR1818607.1 DUF4124 domain-containing protein [Stenotrophomonas muris]MDG9973110.1 DUF4124 domain-containing protein [Stenotrophomonas sp. GD04032]